MVPTSKQLSLEANQLTEPLEFKLYSEVEQGANYTCNVTLYDAEDIVIDQKAFDVRTNSMIQVNNFDNQTSQRSETAAFDT